MGEGDYQVVEPGGSGWMDRKGGGSGGGRSECGLMFRRRTYGRGVGEVESARSSESGVGG